MAKRKESDAEQVVGRDSIWAKRAREARAAASITWEEEAEAEAMRAELLALRDATQGHRSPPLTPGSAARPCTRTHAFGWGECFEPACVAEEAQRRAERVCQLLDGRQTGAGTPPERSREAGQTGEALRRTSTMAQLRAGEASWRRMMYANNSERGVPSPLLRRRLLMGSGENLEGRANIDPFFPLPPTPTLPHVTKPAYHGRRSISDSARRQSLNYPASSPGSSTAAMSPGAKAGTSRGNSWVEPGLLFAEHSDSGTFQSAREGKSRNVEDARGQPARAGESPSPSEASTKPPTDARSPVEWEELREMYLRDKRRRQAADAGAASPRGETTRRDAHPPGRKREDPCHALDQPAPNMAATVAALLRRDADARAVDVRGRGVLHRLAAAPDDCAQLVKELVAAGADVNGRDLDGAVPLHFAARDGRAAVARALVACDARTDVKGWAGEWRDKTPGDVDARGVVRRRAE